MTSNPFHDAPPITRIKGRVLATCSFMFVVDRRADKPCRSLVVRYDFTKLAGNWRAAQIFIPAMEDAVRAAYRKAIKIKRRQDKDDRGNERARKIQERQNVLHGFESVVDGDDTNPNLCAYVYPDPEQSKRGRRRCKAKKHTR